MIHKKFRNAKKAVCLFTALLHLIAVPGLWAEESVIDGCASPVTSPDYSEAFDLSSFEVSGVLLNDNGDIDLDTQRKVLDPDNIEIPIEQEVAVTFLYEGAGFTATRFGWMYETDTNANGTPNTSKIRWIYENINDNNNDGALDNRAVDYNLDGKIDAKDNKEYLVDDEGVPITFKAGTKLVFVLDSSKMYGSADPNCTGWCGNIFYTKTDWNENLGKCTNNNQRGLSRLIKLWANGGEGNTSCYTYYPDCDANNANCHEQGWMDQTAINRINNLYGYQFRAPVTTGPNKDPDGFNIVEYNIANGNPASHAILGAPNNTPDAWILGFDDTELDGTSTNDVDFNDLVFLIERKSGGVAQLKNTNVISPSQSDAFFTKLEFEVYDGMPCEGDTSVSYFYSVNYKKDEDGNYLDSDGNIISTSAPDFEEKKMPVWREIRNQDWEQIYSFTKANGNADLDNSGQPDMSGEFDNQSDEDNPLVNLAVNNLWKHGYPTYTGRKAVIDLASNGEIGRELVWKAEMTSENEACVPTIFDVKINTTVARHANFSRSSPIVQTNVTYSASYETPNPSDSEWMNNPELRGHLKAVEIYDPATATASDDDGALIWNAGLKLSQRNLSNSPRTIYFPDMTVPAQHSQTLVNNADGGTKTFSGTLSNTPVLDGTLVITATTEDGDGKIINVTLADVYSDDKLVTDQNASGSINRFNGDYIISFDDYPKEDTDIIATYYSYSVTNGALETLATSNSSVTEELLNIVDTGIDKNKLINWLLGFETSGGERTWPLGAIDHSSPAVMIPPGTPGWFYGSGVSDDLKDAFYDPEEDEDMGISFKNVHKDRDVVVFVGAMDGMVHAFNGGKFNWGDNPKTDFIEHGGYFVWSGDTSATAQYGTGEELWAYIPGNLMPKQKNNFTKSEGSKAYVDASPALSDVYVQSAWRTVLIFAQGAGGHMITCLDVTNPSSPELLWEFGDSGLFNSQSSPAIGLVKDSGGNAKWVSFWISGSTESHLFPQVYMVDIEDGTLIGGSTIALDSGSEGMGGVGSGQPGIIDSDGDGFVDRIYVGTDKGYMYRVTIENTSNVYDDVINESERDPKKGIYGSPAIISDDEGVRVFFGTAGDSDDTTYTFYAYLDKGGDDVSLDWSYDLPAGQRVYTSVFAAAGQVYFGTTSAVSEDPCDAGGINTGKIYAFSQKLEDENATPEPIATIDLPTGSGRTTPIVTDEHLYIKTVNGKIMSYGDEEYNHGVLGVAEDTQARAFLRSWREVY